ncbi:hypothetical protein ACLF85_07760 [Helicobacter pylori]
MFDFANAKTATANAYAFKLRCAFVQLANASLVRFCRGGIDNTRHMRF